MSGILSIIGPTAVGKTAFAQFVGEKLLADFSELNGIDFISADSRQIYKALEIVSGADIPANVKPLKIETNGFQTKAFEIGKNRLFGVSFLAPDQEWSVAHFRTLAQAIIPISLSENRLPIIVGGTGLYLEHAFHGDQKLSVPPDEELRQQAEEMSLEELQQWVQREAAEKWPTMNSSDQANPRRLIRALEIAKAQTTQPVVLEASPLENIPNLIIGLSDQLENIELKIKQRVVDRWQAGAVQEVSRLTSSYPEQKLPLYSSTGVKPILAFLNDQLSAETAQQAWFIQERQYAKRQFTWWKKRQGVKWYEIDQPEWKAEAYRAIAAWFRSN